MNNNNNNNNNNNTNTTTGYRPIAPSPSSSIINPMIPISPHHSPLSRPSPQQHGILPPPMSFRTPPVSPFSLPINMNPEYLPPPLQPLPPMMSMTTPPSPTNGRYEQRILPKQQSTPSTSVFSVPMTPSNASSVMQHHNSVIHPSYQQQRLGGAATGTNGDKQLTTADQRELARKVSHSAIERRRRERINDKILQLKELIPSCADQDHLHKLSILQSAIEYIQYLQGCVAESRKREGNNNGNSEERYTKRSKFDRYEIPIPKHLKDDDSEYKRKNSSGKSSDSDGETSARVKKATADASTNTDTDSNKSGEEGNNEEANTLLLLSKSTSTDDTNDNNNNDKNTDNNNNNKEIPKTRSVEVQTFPNTNEIIEIEEEQEEEPRRVSVQQLCN